MSDAACHGWNTGKFHNCELVVKGYQAKIRVYNKSAESVKRSAFGKYYIFSLTMVISCVSSLILGSIKEIYPIPSANVISRVHLMLVF